MSERDPHDLMYWKIGPVGSGAPTIELPRWLFEIGRAAGDEAWRRRQAAEATPVPVDRRARRARAKVITQAARDQATILDAVLLAAVWLANRARVAA